MSFAGNVVSGNELSQCFADFFDQKVKEIVGNVRVDAAVYNGERIVTAIDSMFMSRQDIIQCMVNIKVKNCEGYDCISQRVLVDGFD